MTPSQLLFQDWGQPAILRQTVPFYDPDTGQMEESESDSTIQVVAGLRENQPLTATTAVAEIPSHSFLALSSDLPPQLSLQNTQLVIGDRVYAISQTASSPISTLTVLKCMDVTC